LSNSTGAFGLRPVRHADGTPWNGQTIRCYCSSSYSTALYIGDPVLWSPTLTEKDATAKYPTINVSSGATATIIRGVITSFEPNADNLSQQYRPASTERWANVCIATPDIIFQIRDDGDATPTNVFPGQNAICAYAAGSSTTGLSGVYLDGSTTPTTTQAHSLHIVGLADIENNELGDYAIWDVIVNTSRNATGTFLGITAT
jgi:hypothetical protein